MDNAFKVFLTSLIQWVLSVIISIVKRRAYSEIRQEMKNKAEEIKQKRMKDEQEIRDKYKNFRNRYPDDWLS